MKAFCDNYILQTLSKSPHNTKIQIILHVSIWFNLTHPEAWIIGAGLSGFYLMALTVMKNPKKV